MAKCKALTGSAVKGLTVLTLDRRKTKGGYKRRSYFSAFVDSRNLGTVYRAPFIAPNAVLSRVSLVAQRPIVVKLSCGRSIGPYIRTYVRPSVCPVHCGKTPDRIQMPFGIIGRTGPGIRQIVRFGDRSTGRGTFGGEFGRSIVTTGDFTACVCDSAATWPSSQITLGKLAIICCSDLLVCVLTCLNKRIIDWFIHSFTIY